MSPVTGQSLFQLWGLLSHCMNCAKVPPVLLAACGLGETPLCSSFSVWHLLREDGTIVELHLATESPQ